MTEIGDGIFHKGQPIWVIRESGLLRAAEYVGEAGTNTWFGGPPTAFVLYTGTQTVAAVEVDQIIPRDDVSAGSGQ